MTYDRIAATVTEVRESIKAIESDLAEASRKIEAGDAQLAAQLESLD